MYEPLIVLREGETRETSRAAARPGQLRGELYHRACYPLRAELWSEPGERTIGSEQTDEVANTDGVGSESGGR